MTETEIEALRATYEPFTESVRRLVDVAIRTNADAATIAAAKEAVDRVVADLDASATDGPFGVRFSADGQPMAWGNVVIGVRNAVAPPLVVHHEADGSVWTEFELGAAYEGPAGHVHGGVCAMVLDHVLGATAHKPGKPAVTGTLTTRFRRGTRLCCPLRAEAHIDRVEGVKTFVVGRILDPEGVTVEAEGIFLYPRR